MSAACPPSPIPSFLRISSGNHPQQNVYSAPSLPSSLCRPVTAHAYNLPFDRRSGLYEWRVTTRPACASPAAHSYRGRSLAIHTSRATHHTLE
eukprot:6188173-Pleurochrysis_carterae.AAC.3